VPATELRDGYSAHGGDSDHGPSGQRDPGTLPDGHPGGCHPRADQRRHGDNPESTPPTACLAFREDVPFPFNLGIEHFRRLSDLGAKP
jgi:hypothetical protein